MSPTRPRRLRAALALAAAVLVLHGWLLGALPALPGWGGPGEAMRALQVRQIVRPAPLAATAPEAMAAKPAVPRPRRAAAAIAPGAAAAAAPKPASEFEPEPAPEATAPPLPPGGEPLSVYATRLPPAAILRYTAQRPGPFRTSVLAELQWRPDGDHYVLTLGLAATGWASLGMIDAHGLAPERHVETRRGRELRAANFQRDSGRITFSGPQVEYPLLPGAQDRLSWLVQLAAVLAANPALAAAGGEVTLFVAGARGDAGLWSFTSSGLESTELADGSVAQAVHLHREPQRPYDTRADIWLDPARHHLPVRLRLQSRADGEATEFLLQSFTLP